MMLFLKPHICMNFSVVWTSLFLSGSCSSQWFSDFGVHQITWSEVKVLSCVRLFATPWSVAYHAPPSMGFSRQEHWSGLPFTSPKDLPNPGRDQTRVSGIVGRRFTIWGTTEIHLRNLLKYRLLCFTWKEVWGRDRKLTLQVTFQETLLLLVHGLYFGNRWLIRLFLFLLLMTQTVLIYLF